MQQGVSGATSLLVHSDEAQPLRRQFDRGEKCKPSGRGVGQGDISRAVVAKAERQLRHGRLSRRKVRLTPEPVWPNGPDLGQAVQRTGIGCGDAPLLHVQSCGDGRDEDHDDDTAEAWSASCGRCEVRLALAPGFELVGSGVFLGPGADRDRRTSLEMAEVSRPAAFSGPGGVEALPARAGLCVALLVEAGLAASDPRFRVRCSPPAGVAVALAVLLDARTGHVINADEVDGR